MGGGYYDRDENYQTSTQITSQLQQNGAFEFSSAAAEKVGQVEELHPSLDPKKYKDVKLTAQEANPIVFALDVTGSMGEWSKIIYDKLPMFYGQIMLQKYLKEPSMSFCAVGDVKTDSAPLQVSEFSQGSGIDESICKLYLEGNGGGNNHESYDIAAYFYVEKCDLINCEIPFFFLTCDELFWEECSRMKFNQVFGNTLPTGQQKLDTYPFFAKLLQKFNVFVLRKELPNKSLEPNVQKKWCEALGNERVLKISNPKAVIDVILGAISLTSGARDLDGYRADLIARGQTDERVKEVVMLLTPYFEALKSGEIQIVKNADYKPKQTDKEEANDSERFREAKEFFVNQVSNDSGFNASYFKDLLKLSQELEGKIPDEIICPITQHIFCNPVKTTKGKVYEQIAIQKFIEKNENKDPFSGEALKQGDLVVDHMTKEKVYEFYENSKIYLEL